ncbi:unnamed protein product [Caenorhabditis sp. 36 PRJEB53466]|nr:unnamed protein product [Caenorhabditis sp. 36 PRJEB53466]
MKVAVLLLLVIGIVAALASEKIEEADDEQRRELFSQSKQKRFCGARLKKAMDKICWKGYCEEVTDKEIMRFCTIGATFEDLKKKCCI